jgi:hypothetical protein
MGADLGSPDSDGFAVNDYECACELCVGNFGE